MMIEVLNTAITGATVFRLFLHMCLAHGAKSCCSRLVVLAFKQTMKKY
jgi:hypothetical protein